jgi:hypothetical protein
MNMKFSFRTRMCVVMASACTSCSHAVQPPPSHAERSLSASLVRSEPPPNLQHQYSNEGEEQFVWNGKQWMLLNQTTVAFAIDPPSGRWMIGYLCEKSTGNIFYRWKDTFVPPLPTRGNFQQLWLVDLNSVATQNIEPPIQFVREPGTSRVVPGFFDFTHHRFYEFAGISLPESSVPEVSPQHRRPLLEDKNPPAFHFVLEQIPLPDYLHNQFAKFAKH